MAKSVEQLKRSRNGIRLNIRTLLTQVSNVFVNRDTVAPSAGDLNDYTVRLEKLERKLEEIDEKILERCSDGEEEDETREALDFQQTIWSAQANIKTMQDEIAAASVLAAQTQHTQSREHAAASSSHGNRGNLRLPKFELPSFDGDPVAFQEFWDMFEATVHNCSDLSDVEKLRYLKGALTGEAARLATSYRLTNPMYGELVTKLKERFGKPDFAINAHLQQLMGLPEANNDTRSLQLTFDECDRHVRSLTALGFSESEFGKIYAPVILNKMPWSVRKEVSRVNKSSTWTMAGLRDALREEIEARQMADKLTEKRPAERSERSQRYSKPNQGEFKIKPPAASALANNLAIVQSKNAGRQPATTCAFCDEGGHFSDMCPKVTDPTERKQIAIAKRLCFRCLKPGHSSSSCKRNKACFHCSKRWHHSALCTNRGGKKGSNMVAAQGPQQPQDDSDTELEVSNQSFTANTAMLAGGAARVYMQMATVMFKGPKNKAVPARIMFDGGSTSSYVTKRWQQKMNLPITGYLKLANAKFEDSQRTVKSYPCVSLLMPPADGSESILLGLFVTDRISCDIQKHPLNLKEVPELKNLKLADSISDKPEFREIDILIGGDHYFDIILDNQIRLKNGLVLLDSKLGFIPTGCIRDSQSKSSPTNLFVSCFLNASQGSAFQATSIDRLWKLEEIGIKDDPVTPDDDKAVALFERSICEVNGRPTVGWPYKSEHQIPPENRELALTRFNHLIKRISRKKEVIAIYDETIRDYCKKGIIEEVPDEAKRDGKTTYLPHHEVIRTDHATTKLRIVFDGSAKPNRKEPSLNECLLRGPVLLSDLCGLLIRFRTNAVAFTADIEKAYLQVGLREADRDVTRFFWLRNTDVPPKPDNLIVYRFTRVLFGIISSAFLLDATIRHKMRREGSKVAIAIAENTYVDNLATGTENDAEAIRFFSEAMKLFQEISMNLRAWRTNSQALQSAISKDKQASATDSKVLGLCWDCENDELGFQPPKVSQMSVATKRSLLQATSKLFDPCGFLTPVSIRAKLLVQKLWKEKLAWDDQIPPAIVEEWKEIRADVEAAAVIRIPRFLGISMSNFELHTFCDASAKAFATATYIRANQAPHKTILLMSKVRLAPIKTVTIPRLELTAATIGTRLLKFVQTQLKVPAVRCYVWCDSKCVLHWLNSIKVLSVFVENRVKGIRDSRFKCRYVPTDVNPADLPTQGLTACELQESKLWWYGPKFLEGDESIWPPDNIPTREEVQAEVETEEEEDTCLVAQTSEASSSVPFGIDPRRFSTLEALCAITAWSERFVANLKASLARQMLIKDKTLSIEERRDALLSWVVRVQQANFGKENRKEWHDTKKKLSLFKDEKGLWRCGGRMRNADLTEDAKFPILLPKNHAFTRLVTWHAHSQAMHIGPAHTLAQVRTRFWIPCGTSQVKSVIHSCNWCRICEGVEHKLPKVAPLPAFRATCAPPFRSIGMDYLDPVYVSTGHETEKAWICLFTCAVTRAIHLETVSSLSVDEFLLCFRRFVAICGAPTRIVSDNAKYFKLAQKLLQGSKNSTSQIAWQYIPAFYPWMGGVYERLVGSVKRSLKKVLGKKVVSFEVLQTVAYEVAALINTRPLTLSNDVHDQVLTPAHLTGKEIAVSRLLDFESRKIPESTGANLIEMHRQSTRTLQAFWAIWRKSYLAALRATHKDHKHVRGSIEQVPKVGTVVMVKDENTSRMTWPLAVIQKLHESNDGAIRHITLRMSNGVLRVRPVNKVVPLEIEQEGADKLRGVAADGGSQSRPEDVRVHAVASNKRSVVNSNKTVASDTRSVVNSNKTVASDTRSVVNSNKTVASSKCTATNSNRAVASSTQSAHQNRVVASSKQSTSKSGSPHRYSQSVALEGSNSRSATFLSDSENSDTSFEF